MRWSNWKLRVVDACYVSTDGGGVDMFSIVEHKSTSYAPRTYHNASVADVTVALAINHHTAGEKCTQKAVTQAKSWILMLDPKKPSIENARALYHFCKHHNAKMINVAGNGIYTWGKHGRIQEQVNLYIYEMFKLVHEHWPIEKIVSGGQTGTDLAGGVAAYKLGIDCEMTLPKGFKMRFEDKLDRDYTEEFVRELVINYSEKL